MTTDDAAKRDSCELPGTTASKPQRMVVKNTFIEVASSCDAASVGAVRSDKRKGDAAILIQAVFRGFRSRKSSKLLRILITGFKDLHRDLKEVNERMMAPLREPIVKA